MTWFTSVATAFKFHVEQLPNRQESGRDFTTADVQRPIFQNMSRDTMVYYEILQTSYQKDSDLTAGKASNEAEEKPRTCSLGSGRAAGKPRRQLKHWARVVSRDGIHFSQELAM